jgi:hypothetical protein
MGIFVHSACSPKVAYPTSTIACGILRLATRGKGAILQEHVIVSARRDCYSLAGRLALPRPGPLDRIEPCSFREDRANLSGGVDLDICIPFRTVSSSDLTTARLGGGRRLRDRIVGVRENRAI